MTAVLQAFYLAKSRKLPDVVRISYETEDREYDRYSQHAAEQISEDQKTAKVDVARYL